MQTSKTSLTFTAVLSEVEEQRKISSHRSFIETLAKTVNENLHGHQSNNCTCFDLFFHFARGTVFCHLDLFEVCSWIKRHVWENNTNSNVSTLLPSVRLCWNQFGRNPVEVPPKRGYLSFSSVSRNNKHSLSPPCVSDHWPALVKAVAGESPIRGLRPPRGLTFTSLFGGLSCQAQPCALKSLAVLWHVTLAFEIRSFCVVVCGGL